ncbi:MAG: cytochrome c [Bacteroidota bacterium]
MGNKIAAFALLFFVLISCGRKPVGDDVSFKDAVKLDQYIVEGRDLYLQHCSNCHQAEGQGLGRLYPPLNNSDYMKGNVESVICLIRNGISGKMVVNGVEYNQAMPGVPTLTPLEVAEIATYIYNKWELEEGLIDVKMAEKALVNCGEAAVKD